MKSAVKRFVPAPLWRPVSNSYWWWRNRGRHIAARQLDPRWRESARRLAAYRHAHRGERCFIIGNGPSLRQTDLSRLKGEFTFGLNRIYLMFPELGFTTSCLVMINDLVLEQSATEIMSLSLPKFFTWRARRWFRSDRSVMYLDTDFTGPENFSGDATQRLFEGFTVTYAAMQLAFFMGFQQAILVGVDHNYVTAGKDHLEGAPNQAVISTGPDPNHFSPNYFGKGFKWQLPDLEGSERSYRMARQAYADAGRSLVDATVGGKLTIFPKVDFNTLFE
jgi:hypothetical protein